MARIKLTITGKRLFTVSIPVRITDINYGNHLGNDALVSLLHEARVQWLHALGYTELAFAGCSLIQGDLAVEYLNESFYGDKLTVNIHAADITRVSFDLLYEIQTVRNDQPIPVARAKTGLLCFDYASRKVISMPEKVRALLVD